MPTPTRSTLSARPAIVPGLLGVVGLVVVLGLTGCSQGSSAAASAEGSGGAGPGTSSSSPTVRATPAPSTSRPPTGTGSVAAGQKVPAGGSVAASVPVGQKPASLTIASIGVSTRLGDLGVAADGTVQVPSDPSLAGWFDRGPAPGQQGPAVVLGHVDSTTGPAVFARLGQLRPGDPIVITRRDGSVVTFTVDAVQTVPKDHFPTAQTYGPVPGPALRLITCGGSYDHSRGGYQANVIVFAS